MDQLLLVPNQIYLFIYYYYYYYYYFPWSFDTHGRLCCANLQKKPSTFSHPRDNENLIQKFEVNFATQLLELGSNKIDEKFTPSQNSSTFSHPCDNEFDPKFEVNFATQLLELCSNKRDGKFTKIPWTPTRYTLGIQSSFLRQKGNWGRWKHYVILIIWDKRSLVVEIVSKPSSSAKLELVLELLCWFLCPISTWNKAKVLLVLYYIILCYAKKCNQVLRRRRRRRSRRSRQEQQEDCGSGGIWWCTHPSERECVQQASFPCLLSQTTQKVLLSLVPRKLKIQGISEDSTMSGLSESGL